MAPPSMTPNDSLSKVLDHGLWADQAAERLDLLRRNLDVNGDGPDADALKAIAQRLEDDGLDVKAALHEYDGFTDSRRWPIVAVRPSGDQEEVEDRLLEMGFEIVPSLATAYRKVGLIPVRIPPESAFVEALARRPDISRVERSWLPLHNPAMAPQGSDALKYPDDLLHASQLPAPLFSLRDPVRVGLLDSGIDARHPVLQKRLLDQRAFRQNEERVGDRLGHGTAMAGAITRMCPGAFFLSAKVIGEDGRGNLDDAVRALGWMRRQRPDMIFVALSTDLETEGRAILSELLEDIASLGTLVIVPASDPDGRLTCPSDAPGVVSVAMAGSRVRGATITARGTQFRVPRSIQGDRELFPMAQPSGYTRMNGPAIAAAIVAGTAALLIRAARLHRRHPTAREITDALLAGAQGDPPLLDPHRAIEAYLEALAAPPVERQPPRRTPTNPGDAQKRQRTPTNPSMARVDNPVVPVERTETVQSLPTLRRGAPPPSDEETHTSVTAMDDDAPEVDAAGPTDIGAALDINAIKQAVAASGAHATLARQDPQAAEPPTVTFKPEQLATGAHNAVEVDPTATGANPEEGAPTMALDPEARPKRDMWDDDSAETEEEATIAGLDAGWLEDP